MVWNLFSPRFAWSRNLSWTRALLTLLALASELLFFSPHSILFATALSCYAVYAVLVAIKGDGHSGVFGLLALFGDAVFFLVLAIHQTGHVVWLPSIFYLYLIGEAVAFYSPREVLVVAGICVVFCVVTLRTYSYLVSTVVVSGVLACAFSVSKRRMQARTEESERQAADALQIARKAGEAERQRIASDFHDGALQSFISLQMRLEILRKVLERDHDAGMEDLLQLQSLAQSQVRELRAFVRSMRPLDVDGANVFASARRIAENFQKESGIPVTFVGGDTPLALPQEISAEVLQMLREALHNIQKHAGATRVAVAMEKTGRTLEVSVDDNGQGFHFSGTYNLEELELLRLGPASLKRRARSLNADFVLESRPGRGAGLKFRVPI